MNFKYRIILIINLFYSGEEMDCNIPQNLHNTNFMYFICISIGTCEPTSETWTSGSVPDAMKIHNNGSYFPNF